MKGLGYVRNLLFGSLAGYFAQGLLYEQGSMMSQFFLLLIFGISFFYFFKTIILKNKNLFYRTWTALLLLNLFGFVFTGDFSNSDHLSMFKSILLTLLPFYPVYFFVKNRALESKHLIFYFIVLLPITIGHYSLNANRILTERISDSEDVVNNFAYAFVWLIPFVFLFIKRRIVSFFVILLLMFFTVQGAKRGAIMTGAIGMIIFFYYQMRSLSKKKRLTGYTLLLIVGIGIGNLAYNRFQKNEFLISRFNNFLESGGSGRVGIYRSIFNSWTNSDTFGNLLFGYGFLASKDLSITGNRAHNDWLELLSNFGLLGVVIYGVLFYASFKYFRNSNWEIDKRLLMLTVILMWFAITLFSMGYTNTTTGYLIAIFLAFLIGSKDEALV